MRAKLCILVPAHWEALCGAFPSSAYAPDPDRLLSRGGLRAVTGTEDALFTRIAALLDDPDRCAAIGARARRYALDHHAESNIATLASWLELAASGGLSRDLTTRRLAR